MQIDSVGAALSGIRTALKRQAVSAHNVANLTRDDARPLRAEQSDTAGGGSELRVSRAAEPEPVRLDHEVLEQIRAKIQAEASAGVVRTASELSGNLLDVLA